MKLTNFQNGANALLKYSALTVFSAALLFSCGSSSSSDETDGTETETVLSDDSTLLELTVDGITLDQTFQSAQNSYTAADVNFLTTSFILIPTVNDDSASLTINGSDYSSEEAHTVPLAEGDNLVTLIVTAEDETTTTYTLEVTRDTVDEFSEQDFLKADDAAVGDGFGTRVAIDGDTLVVGAEDVGEDASGNAASNSGAAYVYNRVNGEWTQQQKLKAFDEEASIWFGVSVDISGDTIVVGAHNDSRDADGNYVSSDSGGAYVYTRSNGVWTLQQKLKASDRRSRDYFGRAVAIDDDTIVVGAYREDSGPGGTGSATDAGAAYVFTRTNDVWTQQKKLKADDAEAGDYFGWKVDLNGDTIVVGAYGETSGANGVDYLGSQVGAAYVFVGSGDSWAQQQKLKAEDAAVSDSFTRSKVSIEGDTIAVGAMYKDYIDGDTTITSAGAVYVYHRADDSWVQQDKLSLADPAADDYFGYSVAVYNDTLIASSWGGDIGGLYETGAVSVFSRIGDTWTHQVTVAGSNALASDRLGSDVGLSGDTAVAGAEGEDSNAAGIINGDTSGSGAVYVWQ